MKISDKFILKKIMDDYIVIPVGSELVDFNAIITLNETGAFLWEGLKEETTAEALCEKMCAEFDVDKDTAKTDVDEFLDKMISAGILKNE